MLNALPSDRTPAPARAPRTNKWAVLVVALATAFIFFSKLGAAPLNDWDEAWHAQVSREILTTGDWFTLHDRGGNYFNKPPLTFWLRAIAFKIGGVNEAASRFFPALFGWGSVVATAWFAARLFGATAGLLTGLVLGGSWLFTIHHAGRSGESDSTLIFFFTLTVIALWRARFRPRWCYAAGVATALGWMSKGSSIYLAWVACLVAVAIEQPKTGWRWRKAVGGVLVGFLLTLPWQAQMLIRFGRPFAQAFYVSEGALPALQVIENHPGNPWFYLMIFHSYFQPWLVLAAAAVVGKIGRRREPARPAIVWLTSWATIEIAACGLFSTKMAWYATPALPALAALAAFAAVTLARGQFGWIAVGGIAILGVVQIRHQYWSQIDLGIALAMAVAAVACFDLPPARRPWHAALAGLLLLAPLAQQFVFLYGWVYRDEYFVSGMELRTLDEPWRELAARLQSQPDRGTVLLVDMTVPPDPASYFYLSQLEPPATLKPVTTKDVAMSPKTLAGSPIIVRVEGAERLRALGLKEVLREGSLVEMRSETLSK